MKLQINQDYHPPQKNDQIVFKLLEVLQNKLKKYELNQFKLKRQKQAANRKKIPDKECEQRIFDNNIKLVDTSARDK